MDQSDELAGISTLKLTFPEPSAGPEVIWLDANTGVPVQEADGNGPYASVTTFQVERVNAANLPSQVPAHARLR